MVGTKDKKSTKPPSPEPPPTPPHKRVSGKLNLWVIAMAVVTLLSMGTAGYFVISQSLKQKPLPKPSASVVPIKKITALGRLEPEGEVIKLSVANAQDSRVNKLLVKEGDTVKAGQVIAVLQGLDKKQAQLAEAEQNLAVEQAKLLQTQAGEAKKGEIAAQQAAISRIQAQLRTETAEKKAAIARASAELRNAQVNYERYEMLSQEGAVKRSEFDDKRQGWETAQANLNEAKAQLDNTVSTLQEQITQEKAVLKKLTEVRPVDVQVAIAQTKSAQAQVERIKAELDDFYVRVPIAGQIIKINTRVGEQVSTSQGIVELARTNQMYAIAEVYETDVSKVRLSQRATIISEHGGFDGKLQGTVNHIGLQIQKQDVLEADPTATKDARVVEVKIRIDPQDSRKVAGLTNLQVRITIDK
jgi:HlyD family secretion protein